jgi:glycosyltransferase involved in cell wall biosynthesis
VIYPPVEVERFADGQMSEREGYYLLAGRLVPYKNAAAAVEAFAGRGRELVVMGDGPERKSLEKIVRQAGAANIRFLGAVHEKEWVERMRRCRALVFAGVEDFGITAVEALAAGAPVIGQNRGGLREIVEDGRSGILFDGSGPAEVRAAVERFEASGVADGPVALQSHARRFAAPVFTERFREWVEPSYQRFTKDRP